MSASIDVTGQNVANGLLSVDKYFAQSADNCVPCCPGYYAIFVDNPDSLGPLFAQFLQSRQTPLVYVGIATVSLRDRLVNQDLHHRNPSTFFRGLGAVLGYLPPIGSLVGRKNQKNYKFNRSDTESIIAWINEHLSVSWIHASPADVSVERATIAYLRPLLNTKGNPEALLELAQLRTECRRIACKSACRVG